MTKTITKPVTYRQKRKTFSLTDSAFNPLPKRHYVLPGLKKGMVGSIVAPGSAGKGFFTLELCADLVTGKNLLGMDIARVDDGVVFMTAEDDVDTISDRWHHLAQHLCKDDVILASKKLEIDSLAGETFDLLDRDLRPNKLLIEELKEVWNGKSLIVLDTLRRISSAEENDSAAMSQLIGILEHIAQETGSAIIFTHHTNKASTTAGAGGESGAGRGSSAIVDQVRWSLNLTKMSKKDSIANKVPDSKRQKYVCVHAAKINGAEAFPDFWLQRVAGGILMPTDVGKEPTVYSVPKNKKDDSVSLGGRGHDFDE